MPLHVKQREAAGWIAAAEGAGLEVTTPKRIPRNPKRTPAQRRADLVRAIANAPTPLAKRVLTSALERLDRDADHATGKFT